MRLIEAYPVEAGIIQYLAENAYINDTAEDALKMALRWLVEAPTVNPEDLRPKGKWEAYPNDLYLRCSACRMEFYIGHFPLTKKYCPNCGAKMEE